MPLNTPHATLHPHYKTLNILEKFQLPNSDHLAELQNDDVSQKIES